MTEKSFKKRVMTALSKATITTIDLGSGTFDLFLDEGKRCFLELKIAKRNYKFRGKEVGITLSPQTDALRIMKHMPIVLACDRRDADECYLALPQEVKVLVQDRRAFPRVLVGAKHLRRVTFDGAISMIIDYIRGRKQQVRAHEAAHHC